MKKSFISVIVALVVLAVGIKVAVSLLDVNKYRPEIAKKLTEIMGREVKLDGVINLSLSLSRGIEFSIKDVSIANQGWASRPLFAKVGSAEVGVEIMPLLKKNIEIKSFTLSGADIQIEKNQLGESNIPLPVNKGDKEQGTATAKAEKPSGKSSEVKINEIFITDSKLAMRDASGAVKMYEVKSLKIDAKGEKLNVNFDGSLSGAPVKVELLGDALERIMDNGWKFVAKILYAGMTVDAEGSMSGGAKEIYLDKYAVKAKDSEVGGRLQISLKGARPSVVGNLSGGKIRPSDFKPETPEQSVEKGGKPESAPPEGKKYVFSREPLDLSALKSVDAKLDVAIAEIPVGLSSVKDFNAQMNLVNGRLMMSPVKMNTAGAVAEGQIMLDASSSLTKFSSILKAYQIDLAQLVSLGGLESFVAGKGDVDLDVESFGTSMHELAANSNGRFSVVAAGGSLSSKVMGDIAGSLLDAFAPGTGKLAKPGMNCMAAKFKINNGVVNTDGMLIDTAQATLAGEGNINLGEETVNMLLRARSKAVEISSYVPSLRIKGPLRKPSYSPDTASSVEKIAGLISGGATDSGVPDIIEQSGKNACLYTLENPQAAKPVQGGAVQDAVGKAKEKIEDVGGKLLEGIGGKLFGK